MAEQEDAAKTTPLGEVASPGAGPQGDEGLAIGTRVHRYIVLELLGEGGMATVYAAYDPNLDRKVALKVLRRRLAQEQATLLIGEAKTLAKLRHPNILAVHDLGAMSDGRLFMTTDLIEGADAAEWADEKPRGWREVRQVFVDAGRGLAAVHRADIVHRDFKPANILVDANGQAYVADFGIAVTASDGDPQKAGTLAYMAPELISGAPATPASDQCAFGLALDELLHGHRRDGDGPEATRRKVPRFLRTAIARMTANEPKDRFPTMDAAVRAIAADPRRRLVVAALIGAAVVVVAVSVAFARGTREAASPCADDPAALAGTWDAGRRAAVQRALAGTHSDDVDEALTGLDLYARDWRASRTDACLATRVRGDQSEEVLSLRTECLDRRRSALHAMVGALARAEQLGARNLVRALSTLPSIEVCNDVTLLRSRAPLPRDHDQQRQIAALDAELDALNAVTELDQLPAAEVTKRAASIAARAHELDAPHVAARALIRRSDGETSTDKIRTLQQALIAAQAARDYERILGASRSLVIYLCNANRGDETEFTAQLAVASYDAAGQPHSLERERAWIDGSIGLCQSRPELAIPAFSRVYELQVNRPLSADRAHAASAASNVASSLAYLERFDESVAWSEKAEALTEKMRPDSNKVLGSYMAAWNALQAGDHASVERALQRSARGLGSLKEGGGELRCYLPMTQAMLALARDDRATARTLFAESTACIDQYGAAESLTAQIGLRARTELALADNAANALELAKANLAIMAGDPADARNAIAHALVARAHLRQKRLAEAAAELERAEPFLARDPQRDERWSLLAIARAELLLARGDASAAAQLAREARELRVRRNDAFNVAELDALIARATR